MNEITLKALALDLINLKKILEYNLSKVNGQLEVIEGKLNKINAKPMVSIDTMNMLRDFIPVQLTCGPKDIFR